MGRTMAATEALSAVDEAALYSAATPPASPAGVVPPFRILGEFLADDDEEGDSRPPRARPSLASRKGVAEAVLAKSHVSDTDVSGTRKCENTDTLLIHR